jgi:hypothetical protein
VSVIYDELALVIGHAVADRLVAAYGGGNLSIPKAAHSPGGTVNLAAVKLDAVIGPAARDQLIAYYGGEQLYIPRNAGQALRSRERRVLELAAQGLSGAQIAARMAFVSRPTSRWVARVLARHRANGQPDE